MKKFTSASLPALAAGFYAGRRAKLFSALKKDSVAIVVASPERTRSNDTEHSYRQSSDVLYLSGFPEPESVLVFSNIGGKNQFLMFVRPKDRKREIWTGIRAGVDGAKSDFGADDAHDIDQFEKVVGELLASAENVYYRFGRNEHFDEQFRKVWQPEQKTLLDPEEIVHKMRLVKTEDELTLIRYACNLSAYAHVEAMKRTEPGLYEYQVATLIHSICGFNGAKAQAYDTIAGGGNNAVILHYTTNNDQLKDGDLLLVDAGCEFGGYASDITRTFPVAGKFSDAQRELYEVVLAAQLAVTRAAKPGMTLNKLHAISANKLRHGLVKLGILPAEFKNKRKHRAAVLAAQKAGKLADTLFLGRFFMHGNGHWMGLDVHDVSGHDKASSKEVKFTPGMIFTNEPGIYIDRDDQLVPEKYRGIGIRIEDDLLITKTGCEVLTAGVPKSVDEIEALMAEGRAERNATTAG